MLLCATSAVSTSGCLEGGGNGDGGAGGLSIGTLAFDDGGRIPTEYTCEAGGDVDSPPLRIDGVPDGTETLALVVDDPDAPDGTFVHWLLWNIPPETEQIPQGVNRGPTVEGLGGAAQGTNDAGEVGYSGPCPPRGDEAHTYRFVLHAVDRELDLEPGAIRDELDSALEGSVVGEAHLTGTYSR